MSILRNPIMAERNDGVKVVHIRFEGRSIDVPQSDLDVGAASSDNDIKRALARYLETPEAKGALKNNLVVCSAARWCSSNAAERLFV